MEVTKDDFEKTFKSIISRLTIRESDWRVVTSAGAALSVNTPIVHAGVNGTVGAIWVKRDSQQTPIRLTYGGLGSSVGLSLVPFAGNFSFSMPNMPSRGRIYKFPLAGSTLSLHELKGPFIEFEVAADSGPGGNLSCMFIGGSRIIASTSLTPAGYIFDLMATAKAGVIFGGMTATVIPINANITGYIGEIL
ncbi:MAG: hypothetical protein H6972_05665 [Gammaproteobacteria bacterium]|nr:hypothetical protein [Gammaproteobacteria bacterium]